MAENSMGKFRETPWGQEELVFGGNGGAVTVKIITVKPGQRLSLQCHQHREEHWTVLSDAGGTITNGSTNIPAVQGEMHHIDRGALHRISAPASAQLQILEVATGAFDQNDIERLEDDYGRV